MLKTIEAILDEEGHVKLLEDIKLTKPRRILVTILETEPVHAKLTENETALLSQSALAEDWNRSEEDKAWAHLQ